MCMKIMECIVHPHVNFYRNACMIVCVTWQSPPDSIDPPLYGGGIPYPELPSLRIHASTRLSSPDPAAQGTRLHAISRRAWILSSWVVSVENSGSVAEPLTPYAMCYVFASYTTRKAPTTHAKQTKLGRVASAHAPRVSSDNGALYGLRLGSHL